MVRRKNGIILRYSATCISSLAGPGRGLKSCRSLGRQAIRRECDIAEKLAGGQDPHEREACRSRRQQLQPRRFIGLLASLASYGLPPSCKISRAVNARQDLHSRIEYFVNEPVPLNQEFSNIRLLQLGNYAATLTEYRQRLRSIQCTLQQVLRCSQRILPDVANGLVKCGITLLCPDYFFVSTSHFRRSASATS